MSNADLIPEGFKRRMYEDYKYNMRFLGKEKEILSYEVWLKEVLTQKYNSKKQEL